MLGVLPFVEDPDLSVSAARALAQLLPPCVQGDNTCILDPRRQGLQAAPTGESKGSTFENSTTSIWALPK